MSSCKNADLPDISVDSCAPLTDNAAVKAALNHLQCAGQLLQPTHGFAPTVHDLQQARSVAGKDSSD